MNLPALIVLTLPLMIVGCNGAANIAEEPGKDAAAATRDSGHDSTVRKAAADAGKDALVAARTDAEEPDGALASNPCGACDAAAEYCLSQPQFSGCPDGSGGACRQEYGCVPVPSSCAKTVTCGCFYDAAVVGAGGFCGVADGGLVTAGWYQ